jgi:hypothetical protein
MIDSFVDYDDTNLKRFSLGDPFILTVYNAELQMDSYEFGIVIEKTKLYLKVKYLPTLIHGSCYVLDHPLNDLCAARQIYLRFHARRTLAKNFTFPHMRRIFPRLIANDIVSVQPLRAPSRL